MKKTELPFYVKFVTILFGIVLLFTCIYFAQHIAIPLVFALMFAILLNPIMVFLERKKVSRVIAIFITLTLGFILIASLLSFLYIEIAQFADQWPMMQQKMTIQLHQFQQWLSSDFHISAKKQIDWVNKLLSEAQSMIGPTISKLMDVVLSFTLIPVYVFLFMYYKPLLIKFIVELFAGTASHSHIFEVLGETKIVIQSYIIGLMIEASIIAVLNSTGLLILGIDYAILLGVMGALLNIIPYIGGIVAVLLPLGIAITTKDSLSYSFGVIGLYLVIQFIDNHYISPKIVASKVKLNMLISVISVLVAGSLAGVAGMFLALPCIAILKIIFDRIDPLKPWGLLLGEEMDGNKSSMSLNEELKGDNQKNEEEQILH